MSYLAVLICASEYKLAFQHLGFLLLVPFHVVLITFNVAYNF